MRPAPCHPDRPVLGRDLCALCYGRWWRGRPPIAPGETPKRRVYNRIPAKVFEGRLPPRFVGVRHHAVSSFPLDGCPHCGSPWLRYEGREAHCPGGFGGCGHTIYLVSEEAVDVTTVRHGEEIL
jgi:hypothetical protein